MTGAFVRNQCEGSGPLHLEGGAAAHTQRLPPPRGETGGISPFLRASALVSEHNAKAEAGRRHHRGGDEQGEEHGEATAADRHQQQHNETTPRRRPRRPTGRRRYGGLHPLRAGQCASQRPVGECPHRHGARIYGGGAKPMHHRKGLRILRTAIGTSHLIRGTRRLRQRRRRGRRGRRADLQEFPDGPPVGRTFFARQVIHANHPGTDGRKKPIPAEMP